MRDWTRRDVVKTGLAASIGAWGTPREALRSPAVAGTGRERFLLDFGWRFHLGHANDPAKDFGFGTGGVFDKAGTLFAPSRPNFDDSGWRRVDLPHDWAIELPFENAKELTDYGYHPLGRNFPATSIGWYRRVFDLPAEDAGRRISLEFDGVFRDAMVSLNGHFVDRNFSGYAPFRHDVTDLVTFGGRNVLVARVDATEHEGWFYEGAGIYRHVWLTKTSPLHVAHHGTFVTTTVAKGAATITLATELANQGDTAATCQVVQTVHDPSGKEVATVRSAPVRVPAWGTAQLSQVLSVAKPSLWSIETPALYTAVTTIESRGAAGDRQETSFGIRTLRWDANEGFFLNGKRVEIKGTCNHQDHAGVGAALPDRLQYYRIARLKEMGCNAYRTSHNPPTAELLDACDRLGMLVLDELRFFSTEEEGLGQFERMLRRDRNHPSIFAWSIANEEYVVQGTERGVRMARTLHRLAHRLDPSREVTAAMNGQWGKGFTLAVEVQGFNYFIGDIDAIHQQFPAKPLLGTEVASTVGTRGIYANDKERGYLSTYDLNKPDWGATAEAWWSYFAKRPYLAGGFVWTGFDYRGEPTPYEWPCINSHFGIMDTCGFPKDNFYYYQAWWGDKPVLHLFPHWNWAGKEGQEIDVWVHSNLDRVELFLNDKSLGTQEMPRDGHLAWKVPYLAGAIEARGYRGSQQLLSMRRETTGAPVQLTLRPDRLQIAGDGEDVSVIEVQVVDGAGRMVPMADDQVTFRVEGSGRLLGVGNGDPSSHESDVASTRRAFNGCCCVIVQAAKEAGSLRVEATAPGLQPASVVISCAAAVPRPAIA